MHLPLLNYLFSSSANSPIVGISASIGITATSITSTTLLYYYCYRCFCDDYKMWFSFNNLLYQGFHHALRQGFPL